MSQRKKVKTFDPRLKIFDPPEDDVVADETKTDKSDPKFADHTTNFTKNAIIFSFLYFLEGIPYGVQTNTIPIYLASINNENFTSISLTKLALIPWLLKPIFVKLFQLENIKNCLTTLKTCLKVLVIWNLLGAYGLYYLESHDTNKIYFLLFTLQIISHFLIAIADICIDFLQINSTDQIEKIGYLKSIEVCFYKLGAFIFGSLFISLSVNLKILYFGIAVVGLFANFSVKFLDVNQTYDKNVTSKSKLNQNENDKSENSVDNCKINSGVDLAKFSQFLVMSKIFYTGFSSILKIYLLSSHSREISATLGGSLPLIISTIGSFIGGILPKFYRSFSSADDKAISQSDVISEILRHLTLIQCGLCIPGYFYFSLSMSDLFFTTLLTSLINFFSGAQSTLVFVKMADLVKNFESQSEMASRENKTSSTSKKQKSGWFKLNSNELYCWFSNLEIIGKLTCGIVIGLLVDTFGYEKTILFSCLFQFYCLKLIWSPSSYPDVKKSV